MLTPPRLAVVVCGASTLWLLGQAWSFAFLCDDAYISFRYAQNLVDGHGLVFNAGERVEGYTNFLWTVMLAALQAVFGVPPERSALVLGLASTVGVAALVARLGASVGPAQAAVALVLLAGNRSMAVWSTGGLETRMFTFWMLLAVVAFVVDGRRVAGLAFGSVALGLAALTRPEALLFGPCALLWVAVELWRGGARGVQARNLAVAAVGPFTGMVAAHFAFRLAWYGEWLPNTFAAKGTEVWYEAGFRFLTAAAAEHGLIALGPLAVVGVLHRWRATGDTRHVLSALIVVPHLAYLARVGGDHFEYRMLDLAFPLLHLAAADGVVAFAGLAGRWAAPVGVALTAWAAAYQAVIPAIDRIATARITGREMGVHRDLLPEHAPLWFRMPLVPTLAEAYNEHRAWCAPRLVGARHVEHHQFQQRQERWFGPYGRVPRDRFTANLSVLEGAMGVYPYRLRAITVTDAWGLTDAVVARSPIRPVAPSERRLAHVKRDARRYLDARANLRILRAAPSAVEALTIASHATEMIEGTWMPFEGPAALFPDRMVVARGPSFPGVRVADGDGRWWRVEHIVEDFEGPLVGWTLQGTAFDGAQGDRPRKKPIHEAIGGLLDGLHPTEGDRATGSATSPSIRLLPGQHLGVLVGGGSSDELAVTARTSDTSARVAGRRDSLLRFSVFDLPDQGTRQVVVELTDGRTGGWGHLLVDQLVIVRPADAPDRPR